MAWEWIVLAVVTVVGPTLFHRFLPTRVEITIRGGAVFTIHFGPVLQILRTGFKFSVVWAIALLLAGGVAMWAWRGLESLEPPLTTVKRRLEDHGLWWREEIAAAQEPELEAEPDDD